MIQDISPHRLDNQYRPGIPAASTDPVLHFFGGSLLVKREGDRLTFPQAADLPSRPLTYLFTVDDTPYFLSMGTIEPPAGTEFLEFSLLRKTRPMEKHQMFAAMTGKHLADWYRDSRFCGRCGKEMAHSPTERAMVCPSCGNTVYPRIMPAVIVGVKNKDQLLLTRYRKGYPHNALVAGFTEIGETLEETVAREVMEETGLRVDHIRYYKSQPWGVANDLLVGVDCEVGSDTEIHMDPGELRLAQWVNREDIVLQPDDFSLTNEMMKEFKEGRQ